MSVEFGKIIQRCREVAGFTQEGLARHIGLSQQSIAKWESGKSVPREAALRALLAALEVPFSELEDIYTALGRTLPKGLEQKFEAYHRQEAKLRRTEHSDHVDQGAPGVEFPMKPPEMPQLEYHRTCNRLIREATGAANIAGKWDSQLKVGPTGLTLDFVTNDVVVEFLHCSDNKTLTADLKGHIYKVLWRLVLARSYRSDARHYALIVTIATHTAPDPSARNEVLLRRLSAEASMADVTIFLAQTPQQASSLIASLSISEDAE